MAKKRICEICGTVYEPALDICPLCETPYRADASEQAPQRTADTPDAPVPNPEPAWKVAIAVGLSVLLLLFGAFIAYEFLIGSPALDGSVSCTGLYLSNNDVTLSQTGESYYLTASVTPTGTTDAISYTSAASEIATVDASGKITATGIGETTITVTCGAYSATCTVTCGQAAP